MARKQQQQQQRGAQQEAARFTVANKPAQPFDPPFDLISIEVDVRDMEVKTSQRGVTHGSIELIDPSTGWRLFLQLYPPPASK